MIQILRSILSYFLNENLDYDKKIRLCHLFAKYDYRVQMSYKAQIHYESPLWKLYSYFIVRECCNIFLGSISSSNAVKLCFSTNDSDTLKPFS